VHILVLDIHRKDVLEAAKITTQLDKYTKTTLLRLFSPDFSYDNLTSYNGIVLSGSDDMSVYYDPKVRRLGEHLKALSHEGTYILGICGGNQVLAKTYGYRRYKLQAPEVGWKRIILTELGTSDPLFSGLEDRFIASEHHILAVRCDDGARILAENENCVQAILYQPTVRGIQFHPEKSPESGLEFLRKTERLRDQVHSYQVPEKYQARIIFTNFVNMVRK
jgi:GMP synthase-like glutamine amidotransferase